MGLETGETLLHQNQRLPGIHITDSEWTQIHLNVLNLLLLNNMKGISQ